MSKAASYDELIKSQSLVTLSKPGVHNPLTLMDCNAHRNNQKGTKGTFYNPINYNYHRFYMSNTWLFFLIVFFSFTSFTMSNCKRWESEKPSSSHLLNNDSKNNNELINNSLSANGPTQISPSFKRQKELLGISWVRDPFSLETLKKGVQSLQASSSKRSNILPSRPLKAPKDRLSGVELTGIVFFDNQYMALINNTGVRVGDKIEGFTVDAIKRDYIILTTPSGERFRMEYY